MLFRAISVKIKALKDGWQDTHLYYKRILLGDTPKTPENTSIKFTKNAHLILEIRVNLIKKTNKASIYKGLKCFCLI